jgi:hypothetical protein
LTPSEGFTNPVHLQDNSVCCCYQCKERPNDRYKCAVCGFFSSESCCAEVADGNSMDEGDVQYVCLSCLDLNDLKDLVSNNILDANDSKVKAVLDEEAEKVKAKTLLVDSKDFDECMDEILDNTLKQDSEQETDNDESEAEVEEASDSDDLCEDNEIMHGRNSGSPDLKRRKMVDSRSVGVRRSSRNKIRKSSNSQSKSSTRRDGQQSSRYSTRSKGRNRDKGKGNSRQGEDPSQRSSTNSSSNSERALTLIELGLNDSSDEDDDYLAKIDKRFLPRLQSYDPKNREHRMLVRGGVYQVISYNGGQRVKMVKVKDEKKTAYVVKDETAAFRKAIKEKSALEVLCQSNRQQGITPTAILSAKQRELSVDGAKKVQHLSERFSVPEDGDYPHVAHFLVCVNEKTKPKLGRQDTSIKGNTRNFTQVNILESKGAPAHLITGLLDQSKFSKNGGTHKLNLTDNPEVWRGFFDDEDKKLKKEKDRLILQRTRKYKEIQLINKEIEEIEKKEENADSDD